MGGRPELPGDRPWCTVLAGLYKHIYRGGDDVAHCPPHTLGSWDCQERIEVLHRWSRLSSMRSGWRGASQPRRRSRSSSRRCFQTPAWGNREGCSCGSSPCMPSRCHCGATVSPNANTMPKLALAVNVPSHAQSSDSSGGMAWASLDDEDVWDDDFQSPHTPVCHVVWRENSSHRELIDGKREALRGSPGWQTGYQVDIGEEETTLETINPTWRTTCWLQLAVQGISDDKVPWYKLVIPLTVGTEGTTLSLAKCLLTVWRWSVKVLGWDICPPIPTALNDGQFMTKEEVSEGIDEPLWFMAHSHALQQVGKAACRWKWEWLVGKTPEVRVSPLVHTFWEETGMDLTMACVKLGAHP